MSLLDDSTGDRRRARWGLFWTAVGSIAAVVAIVIGLVTTHGDPSPNRSDTGITGANAAPPSLSSSSQVPTNISPTTILPTTAASQSTTDTGLLPHPPSPQRVPLFLLCEAQGAQAPQGCHQGTEAVGDQVFSYDMVVDVDVNPGTLGVWEWSLKLPSNTCSQLVLRFTPSQGLTGGATLSGRVVQEGPASATVSAVQGQIATLTADLNGSPFYLEFKSTAKSTYVWVSGYGICNTDTGVQQ